MGQPKKFRLMLGVAIGTALLAGSFAPQKTLGEEDRDPGTEEESYDSTQEETGSKLEEMDKEELIEMVEDLQEKVEEYRERTERKEKEAKELRSRLEEMKRESEESGSERTKTDKLKERATERAEEEAEEAEEHAKEEMKESRETMEDIKENYEDEENMPEEAKQKMKEAQERARQVKEKYLSQVKELKTKARERRNRARGEEQEAPGQKIADENRMRGLKEKFDELPEEARENLSAFIEEGIDENTQSLGGGEREAVISSYLEAYGELPETEEEVARTLMIANGRFPDQKSEEAEERAREQFQEIYDRKPDMDKPADERAMTIMAYGLRQQAKNRNVKSEQKGLETFKNFFGHLPENTREWNTLQAITYSGAAK